MGREEGGEIAGEGRGRGERGEREGRGRGERVEREGRGDLQAGPVSSSEEKIIYRLK